MNILINEIMVNIKKFIKTHTPYTPFIATTKSFAHNIEKKWIVFTTHRKQRRALKKLEGKNTIRCVFFALDKAVWKYDSVIKKMIESPRFEPIVLVCPIVNYGRESMLLKMEEAYHCYKEKGYQTFKAYDAEKDMYLDVRSTLSPDIIIYTNPYKGLIDQRYYITNYLDILSFYVHYGYNSVAEWDFLYRQPLTNYVWRYYVESPAHLTYVKKFSFNKGVNGVVTGYPGIEELQDPQYKIKTDPWVISDRKVKRIIWAPHHSIEPCGNIYFSNFLQYADFMLKLAKDFSSEIQIAFKPHPLLRDKLIKRWGKTKVDKYYKEWNLMPNTFVSDGEYIDLFLTSDAMIHDSGSFLIEYLYTKKPVMRLMNGDNFEQMLNSFARKCFDVYYKGYNENDIIQFVENVIRGYDSLKDKREQHYEKYLSPYKGMLPSQNIIEDVLNSIDNQILFRK